MTITAAEDLPSASLRLAPALASFVTVSPAATGPLRKGEQVNVSMAFRMPIDFPPSRLDGTIQLRTSDAAGNVLSKPLPVTLNVVWPKAVTSSGFAFTYPPTLEADMDPTEGAVILRPIQDSAGASDGAPTIYFVDDLNPFGLSIENYYSGDPGSDLSAPTGVTSIAGLPAWRFDPAKTSAGAVVVVVSLADRFLRITDNGSAFQQDGVFAGILSSIELPR